MSRSQVMGVFPENVNSTFNRNIFTYCACAAFNWVLSITKNSKNYLVPCIVLPLLTCLCNERLKPSKHCILSTGIEQIKWSLYWSHVWFLQPLKLCLCWIALARVHMCSGTLIIHVGSSTVYTCIYVPHFPGLRGFLLFFRGKFSTQTASFIFVDWHKALRTKKRKTPVKIVENLTFMLARHLTAVKDVIFFRPITSPKIFHPSNHMTRRAIKNILQSETTVKSWWHENEDPNGLDQRLSFLSARRFDQCFTSANFQINKDHIKRMSLGPGYM